MYVNKIKNPQLIQLQAQISVLRNTEKDYNAIEMQLRNLENRYHILNQEKTLRDDEHQKRRQRTNRQISLRRKQLSELESEKASKMRELQTFRLESHRIRQMIAQLDQEKDKLALDMTASTEQEHYASRQIQRLQRNYVSLKSQRDNIKMQSLQYQQQIDKINKNYQILQQQLKKMQIQTQIMTDTLTSIKIKGEKCQNKLNQSHEKRLKIQKYIQNSSQAIRELAIDIELAIDRQGQQRNETLRCYGMVESERVSENQIVNSIRIVEEQKMQLSQRNKELMADIKIAKQQRQAIMAKNKKMVRECELCERHINTLSIQNDSILEELLKFSEEDETIRTLIDRRSMTKNTLLHTISQNSRHQNPLKFKHNMLEQTIIGSSETIQ